MSRFKGFLSIAALLAFEVFAVVALHRAGSIEGLQIDWSHLSSWYSNNPLENLVGASVRMFGLVLAYYLLITTVLYLVLSALRLRGPASGVRSLMVPFSRSWLDKALAVSIVTSAVIGGTATTAMAAEQVANRNANVEMLGVPADVPTVKSASSAKIEASSAEIPDIFGAGSSSTEKTPTTTPIDTNTTATTIPELTDPTSTTVKPTTTSTELPGLPSEGEQETTPEQTTPKTQVEGEQSYRVVSGDNLWTISKTHLAEVRGVEPNTLSDRDVAQYWLQVIDANKSNLRSGDPDLIYPDEVITLPSA